jgi:replication factor A1
MVSTTKTKWKKSRKALRNKVSAGEYLAFLSIKYEVEPDRFFNALILAEENEKSRCGNLSIECRGKTQDKAVFLILKESKVVAQFPILRDFLLEQDNPIRNYMKTDMVNRHLTKKNAKSRFLSIKDLRAGMRQVNLKAKVLEIPSPKSVFTRFGNYASVVNVLIADDTGTIKLCLWNEQIGSISIGDIIQIRNARMSMFRGEKQLNIGKDGTLSNADDVGSQSSDGNNGSMLAHAGNSCEKWVE